MKRTIGWWFSFIVFGVGFGDGGAWAQEVYLCVWRNPERTMTRLFPEARDYRTVTVPIPAPVLSRIEARARGTLLPGQREQYQYYEMLDGQGRVIGHTQAMTEKGEFGAIEFVFGTDPQHRIIGLYIQRQRERDRRFREASFLDRFKGLAVADAEAFSDPLGPSGSVATRAITEGVRKALIEFDELVLKKEARP